MTRPSLHALVPLKSYVWLSTPLRSGIPTHKTVAILRLFVVHPPFSYFMYYQGRGMGVSNYQGSVVDPNVYLSKVL